MPAEEPVHRIGQVPGIVGFGVHAGIVDGRALTQVC